MAILYDSKVDSLRRRVLADLERIIPPMFLGEKIIKKLEEVCDACDDAQFIIRAAAQSRAIYQLKKAGDRVSGLPLSRRLCGFENYLFSASELKELFR